MSLLQMKENRSEALLSSLFRADPRLSGEQKASAVGAFLPQSEKHFSLFKFPLLVFSSATAAVRHFQRKSLLRSTETKTGAAEEFLQMLQDEGELEES